MPKSDIRSQLARLERLIRTKQPGFEKSLLPGAKRPALAKLATLFGGRLPDELRAWFTWHDGQKQNESEGLIPDTGWTAMSCRRVVETHAFLTKGPPDDIQQPWRSTWIPLFDNGGGDHLCFDRDTGAILIYSHEERRRPRAYTNIAALVAKLVAGYERLRPPKANRIPGPALKRWIRVDRLPSERQFAKLLVHTVYAFKMEDAYNPPPRHIICLKLGDDRWLFCIGLDRKRALQHWRELAARPPRESSGFYHDDRMTLFYIRDNRRTLLCGEWPARN